MVSKSVYGTDAKPMLICPSVSKRHVSVWSEQKGMLTSFVMTVSLCWHDDMIDHTSWAQHLGWMGSAGDVGVMCDKSCSSMITSLLTIRFPVLWCSWCRMVFAHVSSCFLGLGNFDCEIFWFNFSGWIFWWCVWLINFIIVMSAQEQHNIKVCYLNLWPALSLLW